MTSQAINASTGMRCKVFRMTRTKLIKCIISLSK
nr:MAG TPA: hypothetical protein [Caudoviricetes sp.]